MFFHFNHNYCDFYDFYKKIMHKFHKLKIHFNNGPLYCRSATIHHPIVGGPGAYIVVVYIYLYNICCTRKKGNLHNLCKNKTISKFDDF